MDTNLREAIVEQLEMFKDLRDMMYEHADKSDNITASNYCLSKAVAYSNAVNGFEFILGYLDGIAKVKTWN